MFGVYYGYPVTVHNRQNEEITLQNREDLIRLISSEISEEAAWEVFRAMWEESEETRLTREKVNRIMEVLPEAAAALEDNDRESLIKMAESIGDLRVTQLFSEESPEEGANKAFKMILNSGLEEQAEAAADGEEMNEDVLQTECAEDTTDDLSEKVKEAAQKMRRDGKIEMALWPDDAAHMISDIILGDIQNPFPVKLSFAVDVVLAIIKAQDMEEKGPYRVSIPVSADAFDQCLELWRLYSNWEEFE